MQTYFVFFNRLQLQMRWTRRLSQVGQPKGQIGGFRVQGPTLQLSEQRASGLHPSHSHPPPPSRTSLRSHALSSHQPIHLLRAPYVEFVR
jgi:hypothetical protein